MDKCPSFTLTQRVWRYVSFSRFMWLLQNKQLWLSRADLLGDAWEMALAGNQLDHVISRHPIAQHLHTGGKHETAIERSKRVLGLWREKTFVSCWNASDYESHALWRVYCGPNEGVAIQTTLGKLEYSIGELPVYQVRYETPGSKRQTPALVDLVTIKRPMFAYESEVRIVGTTDDAALHGTTPGMPGCRLDWDCERTLEFVYVHPQADDSFMETVALALERYAPSLKERVGWSAMRAEPPI